MARNHTPLHLVPAYGRDYKTATAALADWKSGKDFRICDISSVYDSAYCSCRDFTRAQSVMIRFNRLADFVITGGLKHEPVHPHKRRLATIAISLSMLTSQVYAQIPFQPIPMPTPIQPLPVQPIQPYNSYQPQPFSQPYAYSPLPSVIQPYNSPLPPPYIHTPSFNYPN